MSTQPLYIGQGLLKVDPALTGLLAPRDPAAPTDEVAAQADQTPQDRFAGLLAPPQQQQNNPSAPQPQAPPNFPGGTPPISEVPNPRRNLLGRVHDAIAGLFSNPDDTAPTGFEGLLSPEDIASTVPHRGLLGMHQAGKSEAQIRQEKLGTLLTGRQMVAQQQQAQGVIAKRQQIYQAIGLPKDGDPTSDREWATKFYSMSLMQNPGDTAAIKALQPIVENSLKPQPGTGNQKAEIWKDPQGNFHYLAPNQAQGVPEGWTPVGSTSGGGVPQLFRGPKGDLTWVKPGDNVPKGFKPEHTAVTEFVQGNVGDRFDTRRTEGAIKDFRTRLNTLGISKAAPVLNQAILTINDAKNNPDPNVRKVLFSSAIANFVQAADPKAQIRWQLLNYFKENINASATDRVKLLVKRLKDGTLPDSVLEGMAAHLNTVKHMMESEVQSERNSFLKEHNDLDLTDRLGDETAFFPKDDAPAQTSAAPTPGAYSPNNPFAKRKP